MPADTEWTLIDDGKHHTRLALAWHVLRGRPLIYRAEVGTIYPRRDALLIVVETHIRPGTNHYAQYPQPPAVTVACSWCQQPIGDADHFAELIHFPCYDERAAAEGSRTPPGGSSVCENTARAGRRDPMVAAGSTDGVGTPGGFPGAARTQAGEKPARNSAADGAGTAGEAIYPGGGLAFTELRPAGEHYEEALRAGLRWRRHSERQDERIDRLRRAVAQLRAAQAGGPDV